MSTYDDYRQALGTLAQLGRDHRGQDATVQKQLDTATAAAHEIPRQAVKQTEAAKARINQQQNIGRAALARIDQEGLLPARVRPAKAAGVTSATELDRLVATHTTAVERLNTVVRNFERATQEEAARRQAEAQREAEQRSRQRAAAQAEERRRAEEARLAAEKATRQRQLIIKASVVAAVLLLILIALLAF